jgi:hypothetical protein
MNPVPGAQAMAPKNSTNPTHKMAMNARRSVFADECFGAEAREVVTVSSSSIVNLFEKIEALIAAGGDVSKLRRFSHDFK